MFTLKMYLFTYDILAFNYLTMLWSSTIFNAAYTNSSVFTNVTREMLFSSSGSLQLETGVFRLLISGGDSSCSWVSVRVLGKLGTEKNTNRQLLYSLFVKLLKTRERTQLKKTEVTSHVGGVHTIRYC